MATGIGGDRIEGMRVPACAVAKLGRDSSARRGCDDEQDGKIQLSDQRKAVKPSGRPRNRFQRCVTTNAARRAASCRKKWSDHHRRSARAHGKWSDLHHASAGVSGEGGRRTERPTWGARRGRGRGLASAQRLAARRRGRAEHRNGGPQSLGGRCGHGFTSRTSSAPRRDARGGAGPDFLLPTGPACSEPPCSRQRGRQGCSSPSSRTPRRRTYRR